MSKVETKNAVLAIAQVARLEKFSVNEKYVCLMNNHDSRLLGLVLRFSVCVRGSGFNSYSSPRVAGWASVVAKVRADAHVPGSGSRDQSRHGTAMSAVVSMDARAETKHITAPASQISNTDHSTTMQ